MVRLRSLGAARTGAAHLDAAGDDEVLVRFSRSVGLPAPWPDIAGLAVRVPTPGGPRQHADVLMSTTGRGRLSRYLLVPTTRERGTFLSTLVPYRSPSGPVHLGAREVDTHTWHLVWARPRSVTWTPYAELTLTDAPGRDLVISFDAVAGGPPGLDVPGWHRELRGPSYAAARHLRGGGLPTRSAGRVEHMTHRIAAHDLVPGAVARAGPWAVGNRDGELFAVSRRCRHQLADLSAGHVDADGCLVCPWHQSTYDLDTGAMVRGPQGFLGLHRRVPGYDRAVRAYARVLRLRVRPARRDGDDVVVEDGS